MPDSANSDKLDLLGDAASFARISGHDRSKSGYEMVDIDTSDIGSQKSPITSRPPPSYTSYWDGDDERGGKHGDSLEV